MKKMLDIAFIGPLPPPLGGVSTINESFQEALRKNYKIISFNTSAGNIKEDLYKRKNIKNFIHFFKNIIYFIHFLTTNKFKIANIFVTSNIAFVRDSVLIIILFLFRKKIIIHYHSKTKGEFFLRGFPSRITKWVFRLANYIVLLSENHKNRFALFADTSRIMVIENFVDYGLFKTDIPNKKMEFLYVGRLSEKKGIFDLIDAASLLKEKKEKFLIHILGEADNGFTEKIIYEHILTKGLKEEMIFYGAVYGNNKYNFFKEKGIFVFTSHFENSPVVLKEAIASKMAIISSDIDANKHILNDKNNTLFYPVGDSNCLAKLMEFVLRNPDKTYELMANSARCKAYDKGEAVKKMSLLFSELA